MKIADINPHIRFAEQITYYSKNTTVCVKDCRLFYILDGEASLHIDEKELILRKDSLFYCCAGSRYSIETTAPIHLYSINFDLTQNHRLLTTAFSPQEFNKTKIFQPIDKCDVEDSDFINTYLLAENCIKLKSIVSDIADEFSLRNNYFRESCSAMLKKILTELHKTNTTETVSYADTVKKVTDYINSNFTKEITNEELSKLAGFHEYYLNRLFNKRMGISMHRYILILRMNEAKRLLLNTDVSIADIAYRAGFNSHAHFSAYFKKEMNMSPVDYRNSFRNRI